MFELVVPMFQAVGIDAQVRTMDRSLWEERVRRGREFDATAHQFGANSGIAAMLDARYFVPINANSLYAPGWQLYYTEPDNRDAIEPPPDVKAQQDLLSRPAGDGRSRRSRRRRWLQLLETAADQFLVFGVSLPPDGYGIVKNNMVNVMDDAELVRLADARPGASGAVLQGLIGRRPTQASPPPALTRGRRRNPTSNP